MKVITKARHRQGNEEDANASCKLLSLKRTYYQRPYLRSLLLLLTDRQSSVIKYQISS
ncbi:hypothetical protein BaRGS_00013631, partial [Batillaria attramentaria]